MHTLDDVVKLETADISFRGISSLFIILGKVTICVELVQFNVSLDNQSLCLFNLLVNFITKILLWRWRETRTDCPLLELSVSIFNVASILTCVASTFAINSWPRYHFWRSARICLNIWVITPYQSCRGSLQNFHDGSTRWEYWYVEKTSKLSSRFFAAESLRWPLQVDLIYF